MPSLATSQQTLTALAEVFLMHHIQNLHHVKHDCNVKEPSIALTVFDCTSAHLVWHTDVLDGVATNVALGHLPEAVTVLHHHG